jgi:dynein intermediate chain 1
LNDTNGVIILYSLKTPSFFEWKILTNSGCISLDFHPTKPYLIAAGFYDGTVNVFDCRTRSKKEPKFGRDQINDRHRDPVWQVILRQKQIYLKINY